MKSLKSDIKMPQRIEIIGTLFEVISLAVINLVLLIAWSTFLASIPIVFSTIYSIARIKRDIDKYHNGKLLDYFKYIIGKAKKINK